MAILRKMTLKRVEGKKMDSHGILHVLDEI